MEPIKTPTNEALSLQLENLKYRIITLEADVDSLRDITAIGYQRCMKWDYIQDRSINRLWWMSLLLACSIITHSIGHMLTNWGK